MMPAHPDEASRQRQEMVGWFMRRQDAAWSASDERAFQQWLDAPGRRAAYTRWEADWQLMDALPQASVQRLRDMVAEDRRAVPAPASPGASVSRERRRMLKGGWALAGIAGMAATGSWLGWRQLQGESVYEQAWRTERGQQREVSLPDGSTLTLDTATELQARFDPRQRQLRLAEGQALFSIAADAARPLQVLAGSVRITVVGTRFTVRLTPGIPGREGVEIAVQEGRVQVGRPDPASAPPGPAPADLVLTAGDTLAFDADGRHPVRGRTAPDTVASWHGMLLSFNDVPLRQAVMEMQRYGDIGISAMDPAAGRLRLTGSFDPRHGAAVRRLIAGSLPVRLEQGPAGFEIRTPP